MRFGAVCVGACGGGKNVYYFAAARESHKKSGFHYHVSILCSISVRWMKPWKYLQNVHDIAKRRAVRLTAVDGSMEGSKF